MKPKRYIIEYANDEKAMAKIGYVKISTLFIARIWITLSKITKMDFIQSATPSN